ncbi:hypothetical protein SDJN02_24353, partial [Cucurbita argyrosperma subsp. argyrosperma]
MSLPAKSEPETTSINSLADELPWLQQVSMDSPPEIKDPSDSKDISLELVSLDLSLSNKDLGGSLPEELNLIDFFCADNLPNYISYEGTEAAAKPRPEVWDRQPLYTQVATGKWPLSKNYRSGASPVLPSSSGATGFDGGWRLSSNSDTLLDSKRPHNELHKLDCLDLSLRL